MVIIVVVVMVMVVVMVSVDENEDEDEIKQRVISEYNQSTTKQAIKQLLVFAAIVLLHFV